MLRTRGLRWMVSQGDLWQLPEQERTRVRSVLLDVLDPDVFASLDAGNEVPNNSHHGADPDRLRAWIDPLLRRFPHAVWSRTTSQSELKADLDRYGGNVFDEHGYRGGRFWDKLRHIFSLAYESGTRFRLGVQSEPFGPGSQVSASEHKHELTAGVMELAAVLSAVSRQWWTYFCSPSVKSGRGESFLDMPGFATTPAVMARLPRDLMRFEDLEHGGATQSRRLYEVTDGGGHETARADHALSNDGRYVVVCYDHPERHAYRQRARVLHEEGSHAAEGGVGFASWGRVA